MERFYHFIETNPTVAVSIFAVFFSLLFTFLGTWVTNYINSRNIEKQLSVQLRITVQKEWIEKVREHTASINYQGVHLAQSFATRREPEPERERNFLSSIQNLKMYLDERIEEHASVLALVEQLKNYAYHAKSATDIEFVQSLTDTIAYEVIAIANNLNK